MGLSYHYSFCAPGMTSAEKLLEFLKAVEADAEKMGFEPTLVLSAEFDTVERREFARRLTTGFHLENAKLKGVFVLRDGQVWRHDLVHGDCWVIPERGTVLVVTDEQGRETVFGFFQYPAGLKDLNGLEVVPTGIGERWIFRNFVDSPDPRFRKIVKRFADAGYLDSERDEFSGGKAA
ncbi:MAG: hypothetical protein KJ072_18440 [Verrucomicrobia bacterium]|nr:hypothetical protein [Verrucomicrobiota bacterium]